MKSRSKKLKLTKKLAFDFKVNDFVFAKVRTYIPWPAQIQEISKNRCTVGFFGCDQM